MLYGVHPCSIIRKKAERFDSQFLSNFIMTSAIDYCNILQNYCSYSDVTPRKRRAVYMDLWRKFSHPIHLKTNLAKNITKICCRVVDCIAWAATDFPGEVAGGDLQGVDLVHVLPQPVCRAPFLALLGLLGSLSLF